MLLKLLRLHVSVIQCLAFMILADKTEMYNRLQRCFICFKSALSAPRIAPWLLDLSWILFSYQECSREACLSAAGPDC